ncbi:Kelch repeat-containing protein [Intrasporangium oryzae]|uniref:hypothetical protein n=1 Tax=Intrasporangium oryzae TaxID=412687 RepID=UPI0012F72640|nr:hypothetical protein [Intrasporangium oryzae]
MSAAMDAQSARVVVLDELGRTWTLDVCTGRWTEPTTTGSPPAGSVHVLYDPASDLTYAFGDSKVATFDVQTATWKVVGDSDRPSRQDLPTARDLFLMDEVSRTVYAYRSYTGELDAYDLANNTWSTLPQGQPRPPAGADAVAAFDASVRKIVLKLLFNEHGLPGPSDDSTSSSPTPFYGQTWTFDPASRSWTKVTGSTPALNFGYFPRGTEMTYDAASRKTVVFSDAIVATFDATTGKWATPRPGTDWPKQTSSEQDYSVVLNADGTEQHIPLTVGPLSRIGHGLVDDVVNGRVLVLGGQVRTGDAWRKGSDAWAYRVAANAWTEVVPLQPAQGTPR